jgi:hypothetical protein
MWLFTIAKKKKKKSAAKKNKFDGVIEIKSRRQMRNSEREYPEILPTDTGSY